MTTLCIPYRTSGGQLPTSSDISSHLRTPDATAGPGSKLRNQLPAVRLIVFDIGTSPSSSLPAHLPFWTSFATGSLLGLFQPFSLHYGFHSPPTDIDIVVDITGIDQERDSCTRSCILWRYSSSGSCLLHAYTVHMLVERNQGRGSGVGSRYAFSLVSTELDYYLLRLKPLASICLCMECNESIR